MKFLLIQISIICQGGDGEGWGQLLFLMAMLAFYAAGALINKLKKKTEEKEREAGRGAAGAARPVRGPEKMRPEATRPVRPVLRRPAAAPAEAPEKEIVRPKTPAEIAAERLIEFFGLEEVMAAEAARRLPPVKEVKPAVVPAKKPAAPKVEAVKVPEVKKVETKAPEKGLLDIKDPQDVRRAIIHYEIFGRPLSLRERS
jgi:hypothetical protein